VNTGQCRVISLHWYDGSVVGTMMSGDEVFSLCGLHRDMTYAELQDGVCRSLGIEGKLLSFHKDGGVISLCECIGDLEQVVAQEVICEEVEVKELVGREPWIIDCVVLLCGVVLLCFLIRFCIVFLFSLKCM